MYIHTYIHTYIHEKVHPWLHFQMGWGWQCSQKEVKMPIHESPLHCMYTSNYIYVYIYIYIYTYIHTHIHETAHPWLHFPMRWGWPSLPFRTWGCPSISFIYTICIHLTICVYIYIYIYIYTYMRQRTHGSTSQWNVDGHLHLQGAEDAHP